MYTGPVQCTPPKSVSILQAIILGIVQGITEFLPISSQAHLLLVPYFLKWDYQGLGFDIALHFGTLVAVIFVFWRDYWNIIKAIFATSPQPSPQSGEGGKRFALFLIIATIPAAVIGYLFKEQAETMLRSPVITVFTLTIFAILMWMADKTPSSSPPIRLQTGGERLTWKKSLFIGFAQAVAIVPGVSRSGVTITAGLFAGVSREAAARFSFLLSGPIILGAGIFALKDSIQVTPALIAGFLAAAISGFAAIKFLLKYLTTHGLKIFVWYRIILAGIILISLII